MPTYFAHSEYYYNPIDNGTYQLFSYFDEREGGYFFLGYPNNPHDSQHHLLKSKDCDSIYRQLVEANFTSVKLANIDKKNFPALTASPNSIPVIDVPKPAPVLPSKRLEQLRRHLTILEIEKVENLELFSILSHLNNQENSRLERLGQGQESLEKELGNLEHDYDEARRKLAEMEGAVQRQDFIKDRRFLQHSNFVKSFDLLSRNPQRYFGGEDKHKYLEEVLRQGTQTPVIQKLEDSIRELKQDLRDLPRLHVLKQEFLQAETEIRTLRGKITANSQEQETIRREISQIQAQAPQAVASASGSRDALFGRSNESSSGVTPDYSR